MRTIFVRPTRKNEGAEFIEWSKNQAQYDPEVAWQPRTFTLAAYDKEKTVMHLPVQQPYFLETAAINPLASDLEVASAFKEILQQVVTQAHINGVSEIYFLSSDKGTDALAAGHIFEKVPLELYRVRISDLEPVPQES